MGFQSSDFVLWESVFGLRSLGIGFRALVFVYTLRIQLAELITHRPAKPEDRAASDKNPSKTP